MEERPMAPNRMAGLIRPRSGAAASLTPKEVLGILRRHILLIIALTFLGFMTGGTSWYLIRKYLPRYTATTYIQVLPPVETDPMTISTTQLQKDILYAHRQSIANLIKQQSSLERLVASDEVKNTRWFERRDRNIRKAVKYLNRHFRAYAHRDSDFVEIAMTCRAAREAADIVNEMRRLFLARQEDTEKREVLERLAGLQDRQEKVQEDLDLREKALRRIRSDWGITDLEMPVGGNFQHTITTRLNSLELEKNQLDLAIKQLQADISNLERLATGPITKQIESIIERDSVMITLAQQLAFLEGQLSGKLSKFGPDHRDVRQTRQLIDEIQNKREQRRIEIAEQIRWSNLENARDSLIVLRERYEHLEKLRQEAEAKKKELDLARAEYEQELKKRDERLEMLNSIKTQVEKLKIIAEAPETPKVLDVGPAPIPLEMVFSRQWYLWLPGGIMLGLLLGVGLAFIVELANDRMRTPSDVAKFLHIPLLGVIPDASEDSQVRGVELCHAVRQAPYSVISESYRRCRANLKLSGSAESLKTLLVSSGSAGDGKTSVAVNLATTFVATDKKVLLIDANFRQPNLQKLFPRVALGNMHAGQFNFGLSSVLVNQCEPKQAIRPSGIEDLDIIDTGPLPANPAELLGSPQMVKLLEEQRNNYDYVIVDGPPVLLVSDAKVLARLVDATILVFNAAATSRGAAQRTIRELKEVDAKILGCVLFAARAIKGGYFHEQFKSYRRYQKKAQLAAGSV